jgi:TonB family protein
MLRSRFAKTLAECDPSGGNPAVGGRNSPPRKIKDLRPVYPEGLRSAGIGGTVHLDAIIGVDGRVRESNPVAGQSIDAGLVQAATDAVMQWEFDGTLLNCVPVEVTMEVSVSFRPE